MPAIGARHWQPKVTSAAPAEQEDLAPVLSEWRSELRSGDPYFLWVHLLDPHAPYTPREPWLSQFWGSSSELSSRSHVTGLNEGEAASVTVRRGPAAGS